MEHLEAELILIIMRGHVEDLHDKLNSCIMMIEGMRTTDNDLRAELLGLDDECSRLQDANDELRAQLKEKEKRIEEQIKANSLINASWSQESLKVVSALATITQLEEAIKKHLKKISDLKQGKTEVKTACEIEKRELRAGNIQRDKEIEVLEARVTELERWKLDGQKSVETIEGIISSNPVVDFITAVTIITLDSLAAVISEVAPAPPPGSRHYALCGPPSYKNYREASYVILLVSTLASAISIAVSTDRRRACYVTILFAIGRICLCFGALLKVISDEEVPVSFKIGLLMLSFCMAIAIVVQDWAKDKKLAVEVKKLKGLIDS